MRQWTDIGSYYSLKGTFVLLHICRNQPQAPISFKTKVVLAPLSSVRAQRHGVHEEEGFGRHAAAFSRAGLEDAWVPRVRLNQRVAQVARLVEPDHPRGCAGAETSLGGGHLDEAVQVLVAG